MIYKPYLIIPFINEDQKLSDKVRQINKPNVVKLVDKNEFC